MIVQRRHAAHVREQEDVYYYITVMNENYAAPRDAGRGGGGHPQGHVPVQGRRQAAKSEARGCSCWARGTILREVIAAADLLADDCGVAADIWSVPELHRTAPRRHRGRALEPAASDRAAAQEPCRDSASTAGAGR